MFKLILFNFVKIYFQMEVWKNFVSDGFKYNKILDGASESP